MARDKPKRVKAAHCLLQNQQVKPINVVIESGGQFEKGVSACFPVSKDPFDANPSSLLREKSIVGPSQGKMSTLYSRSRRTVRDRVEQTSRIGRLNATTVIPTRYTLCIKPDFQNSKFDGSVLIECELKGVGVDGSPGVIARITLNSMNLVIGKVLWADLTQSKKHEASDITYDTEFEQMTLYFDPPLPTPDKGILIINFSGRMSDTPDGFYRVNYLSSTGEEKIGGVTKFSPTFARKLFPCWDEPHFKAKFDISLILPKHFTALSNMPVQGLTPHRSNKHLHVVEFVATPIMSTHLLAFAIGDFEQVNGHVGTFPDFVSIELHTGFGKSVQAQFALDTLVSCLEFYQQYFDLPVKLAKLDILSLTAEGTTVGYGNWGLTTCHESDILLEREDDLELKVQIARVMSQTTVRQWIGSLVTTDWWSGVWVTEGLATFFEYMSLEVLHPEYQMWDRFVGDVVVRALEADAVDVSITHSLDMDIYYPRDIKENFDVITSGKGAAVLRMCQQYLGRSTFQRGIQEYLKRFAHGTASSSDFLGLLEEVSQRPVCAIFDIWTKRSGFPLIKIEEFGVSGTTRSVTIHQEPFLPEATFRHKSRWIIPIQVTLGRNPTVPVKEFLMDRRIQVFKLTDTSPQEWFMLNPGFVGFYRVKYPAEMMAQFLMGIKLKSIPPADRLGLLNNQYALTSAGYVMSPELFTMLESFVEEDDYGVWKEIDRVIGSLDLLLQKTDCHPKFKRFVRSIFRRIFEIVGWRSKPGESSTITKLRTLVLRRLIQFGYTPCLPAAIMDFRLWMSGATIDQQEIAFQAGMCGSGNDDEVFRTLIRHFKGTTSEKEKRGIIQSLGFAGSESVVKSVLHFANSDIVTPREAVCIMDGLNEYGFGKDLAWEFFKENVDSFYRRFSSLPGPELGVQLIEAFAKYFVTEDKLEQLIALLSLHQFSGTQRVIQETLDRIKLYSAWFRRDRTHIAQFLASNGE